MAEQKLHGRWYLDLRSGETKPFALEPGDRAWVTHDELVDPASAAAGKSVRVALHSKTGDDQISLLLSAERPVAPVRSIVMLDDTFWFERDHDGSADSVVWFVGGFVNALASPDTEAVEDGEDQEAALEEEEEEEEEEEAYLSVDLRSGETKPFALEPGQRAWVSHAQLVHPSSAATGHTVRVALRTKTGVQSLVLSANRNVVMVPSTVMLDEEFWLEREDDDSADAVFRFVIGDGNVHAIPERETVENWEVDEEHHEVVQEEEDEEEEEEDDREAVDSEFDEDVEMVELEVYEVADPEESDDGDDSSDDDGDDEEEESDGELDVGGAYDDALQLQMVHPKFVPGAQFAAAGNTAGFMRVADADGENQEGGGDRQILVLYRYTRFSAAWSDGSVEARGSTKEHQLRFIAAAGHGARSLAWAGALLAPLIYPGGSSKRLRKLWTSLASQVSLPPGAARVKVFVDVGILRQADRTQESMRNMRFALEDMMAQQWPTRFTGMELNLPEPVRCRHDEDKAAQDNDTDGEQRPAKRRRVVPAGENCGVCLELLEGDELAAWPGCGKPHVFHGRCLELVLEKSETCPTCPICRRGLYIEPKF